MQGNYGTINNYCLASISGNAPYLFPPDGQLNYPDDLDEDGVCKDVDNCPEMANPDQADSDGDGVGDTCDNCVLVPNEDQVDSNDDGIVDVCDEPVGAPLFSNALVMLPVALLAGAFLFLHQRRN